MSCEDSTLRKSSNRTKSTVEPQDATEEGVVITVVNGGAVRLDNTTVYFDPEFSKTDFRVRMQRLGADVEASSNESQALLGNASGAAVQVQIVDLESGDLINDEALLKPFKFEQILELENAESPLIGVVAKELGSSNEALEVVETDGIERSDSQGLNLTAKIRASFASRTTNAVLWFVSDSNFQAGGTVTMRTSSNGSTTGSSGTTSGTSSSGSGSESNGTSDLTAFNFAGSLVNSFGNQGKGADDVEGTHPSCVFFDNLGRPLVASRYLNNLTITRFTANGQLDIGFNNGFPRITHNLTSSTLQDYLHCVPTSDGGMFAFTSEDNGSNSSTAFMTKISPSGLIDTSFGTNGTKALLLYPGSSVTIHDAVADSQGYIYIVFSGYGEWNRILIYKYSAAGNLVSGYGTMGTADVQTQVGNQFQTKSAKLDSQGRLLIVGSYSETTGDQVFVARLNSSGTVDDSFGSFQSGVYAEKFNPANLGNLDRKSGAGDIVELDDGTLLVAAHIRTSTLGLGVNTLTMIKLNESGQRIGNPVYHSTAIGMVDAQSMHTVQGGFIITLVGNSSIGASQIVGMGEDLSEKFRMEFPISQFGQVRGGLGFDGNGNAFAPFQWTAGGTNNGYTYIVKFN